MTKYRILGISLPLVLGLTTLLIVPPRKGQEQTTGLPPPSSKFRRKPIHENTIPIAQYSAPQPTDSRRQARALKRDKSDWGVNPDSVSDNTAKVDAVDLTLPAFPLSKAVAVVSGTVTDAKAYLSKDKTGVYSVFSMVLDEVFENPGKLAVGSLIELEREGGGVQFPSGRVHLYMVADQGIPRVGGQYVVFLAKTDDESVFEIMSGYEITADSVYSLDDLPKARSYDGTAPRNFFNALRMQLTKP